MASFFKENSRITFNGYKGVIIKITETFRKNVLVVKVTEFPRHEPLHERKSETIGLFEYPDGRLEFMAYID